MSKLMKKMSLSELSFIVATDNYSSDLKNEAYEYKSINLLNESVIPKDCNVLLMMSPTSDLLENETAMILG